MSRAIGLIAVTALLTFSCVLEGRKEGCDQTADCFGGQVCAAGRCTAIPTPVSTSDSGSPDVEDPAEPGADAAEIDRADAGGVGGGRAGGGDGGDSGNGGGGGGNEGGGGDGAQEPDVDLDLDAAVADLPDAPDAGAEAQTEIGTETETETETGGDGGGPEAGLDAGSTVAPVLIEVFPDLNFRSALPSTPAVMIPRPGAIEYFAVADKIQQNQLLEAILLDGGTWQSKLADEEVVSYVDGTSWRYDRFDLVVRNSFSKTLKHVFRGLADPVWTVLPIGNDPGIGRPCIAYFGSGGLMAFQLTGNGDLMMCRRDVDTWAPCLHVPALELDGSGLDCANLRADQTEIIQLVSRNARGNVLLATYQPSGGGVISGWFDAGAGSPFGVSATPAVAVTDPASATFEVLVATPRGGIWRRTFGPSATGTAFTQVLDPVADDALALDAAAGFEPGVVTVVQRYLSNGAYGIRAFNLRSETP